MDTQQLMGKDTSKPDAHALRPARVGGRVRPAGVVRAGEDLLLHEEGLRCLLRVHRAGGGRVEVFNLPTWAELGRVGFSNLLASLRAWAWELGAGSWE